MKIIGIFVMVVGSIICTAIAISAGIAEAFLAMGLAEACVIIVGLTILGLGSACKRISRLEHRVAELERRAAAPIKAPVATAAHASVPAPASPAAEKHSSTAVPSSMPMEMAREMAPDMGNIIPSPRKKKSRVWIPILIVVIVVVIAMCALAALFFLPSSESGEPETLSIEDAYMLLVDYAANGSWSEAGVLPYEYTELPGYEDAQLYLDYCDAMEAYNEGALGYAYSVLRTMPHILDAQTYLAEMDSLFGSLNGYYVEDNGMGAFLHLVIRDGLVAKKVIGYFEPEKSFNYTDEDFTSQLILSTYTDGTLFFGIGQGGKYATAEDINYAISTFDDSSDIMVIAMEGEEFSDFNGLYERVAEVSPWEPDDGKTELGLGEAISTDFVTMSFDDYVVAADVKHSVTTGFVTRITGPEPLAGQKYICLSGTIQNTSTAPLPVYDFFLGNFELDGYNYEVTANDIDVLDGEGQTKSEIDPLMTYNYRLYVAIPDTLADSYSSCNFTFGFFDGFENQELSYIRSFEDDPISLCPYQYDVKLK